MADRITSGQSAIPLPTAGHLILPIHVDKEEALTSRSQMDISPGIWSFRRLLASIGRRLFGTLVRVETTEPLVALTFDDGPHPVYTSQILELCNVAQARATFFVIGKHAVAHRDIVRRIGAEGHAIGNHTFTHIRMPQTQRWRRWQELWQTQQVLLPYRVRLFRPPYGGQSYGSRFDTLLFGYEVVAWTFHIEDWVHQPAEQLATRLVEQIRPGSIVLLHDRLVNPRDANAADRSNLVSALAMVLPALSSTYRFVTVPELLRTGKPVRVPWFRPAL